MFRWSVLALFLGAAGCGERCDQVFDKLEADWCYARESGEAARSGDLARARALMTPIQSRRVRRVVVEQILSAAPPGLDRDGGLALCQEARDHWAVRCQTRWDASYLWETP